MQHPTEQAARLLALAKRALKGGFKGDGTLLRFIFIAGKKGYRPLLSGFRLADQHLSGNMQSLAQPADHVE
jgi:hypothetical protein